MGQIKSLKYKMMSQCEEKQINGQDISESLYSDKPVHYQDTHQRTLSTKLSLASCDQDTQSLSHPTHEVSKLM